ncbi:MAG: SMI1/KNR4 family protein [Mucilaginibacter sp.]
MADVLIENIIDTYLQKLIDAGINATPDKVESKMSAPGDEGEDGWYKWMPIASTVTDEEIAAFEIRLGHKLPADYIAFLKYKHFHELMIAEASFCQHPVNTWMASLSDMIFNGYPREYLLDRGLIPFANWSDWGLLCFDVNRNFFTANYPIVLWDHETADWHDDFCISFRSLIKKLDSDDKKSWEAE